MSFYIRRTKWSVGRVTVSDFGPFDTKEEAQERLRKTRYNKHTDIAIIEKEKST